MTILDYITDHIINTTHMLSFKLQPNFMQRLTHYFNYILWIMFIFHFILTEESDNSLARLH